LFELELSVEALITTLSVERLHTPLARLELKDFSMKHVKFATGEVDSTMSLQSLQVFDLFSYTPPILATSILHKVQDDKMISIQIQYRKEATRVQADFHQLHVNWNPETVSAYKDAYHVAVLASEEEEEEPVLHPLPLVDK
jgi:hypothetical protein